MESYESTENALMDSFKAAALKVTTLYKDSLVQNRKAYAAGYQQALQDLYEFISVQPENGFVSVHEILNFARDKSNQLAAQINNTHVANNSVPQKPTIVEEQQPKPSPFQIDPLTPFTFTHELPVNNRSMDDLWNQATNNSEGSKKRMNPTDISFMGRSINFNSWSEPPFKKGRSRREEPNQLHLQQQVQQQYQQQNQQHFSQLEHQQHYQQHYQQQQQQNNNSIN